MFNKYILLIVGLVAAVYVSTTNASGLCSCSCCDGDQCNPIYEGTAIASSCNQSDCITACKSKFEDACGSFYTTISVTCQEISTTTVSTPTTTITAYGLCSCSCCDGDQCNPIYEGTAIVSSCDQSTCITACKSKFEDACGSFYTTISVTCQEMSTTTVSTPTTTTAAYDLCSCSCCDGDQCNPIYEGAADASSCAEFSCLIACKAKFEQACNSPATGNVAVTCQERTGVAD